MKYLYNLVCCSILISLVYSCTKDKNDYSYTTLNKLSVTTGAEAYVIEQLDVLSIKPNVSESIGGGGPFTYEWLVYKESDIQSYNITPTNPPNTAIKLSTDRDLNKAISLVPGNYTIQYNITDTKTKVSTYSRYKLTVNGKYYEGWTVTANKAGNAEVSFIRMDNKVFTGVVSTPLKGAALGSFSAVILKLQDIVLFTDQEIYRLSANDFSQTGSGKDLFRTAITPSVPFYTINPINTDQYIVNNGGIYATISPYFGDVGPYSERFNLSGSEYSAFPYYMYGDTYRAVFYDNKGKRFLQTGYNSRALSPFPYDKNAPFDLNNVGKTAVSIDMGPGYEYYCVMKDNSNYYLYTVSPDLASPAVKMQTMQNSPDITTAAAFTVSETLKQLYYGAGNKIYVYDALANSARLIYQFPAGINVKDLKMFKGKLWQTTQNEMFNKRIVVATYNGTEGEVYYFDLSPTGDVANNTYSNKFGGFGNIVQLDYRNPNQ